MRTHSRFWGLGAFIRDETRMFHGRRESSLWSFSKLSLESSEHTSFSSESDALIPPELRPRGRRERKGQKLKKVALGKRATKQGPPNGETDWGG